MDCCSKLVVFLSIFFSFSNSYSAFVYPTAPVGFSGSPGNYFFSAPKGYDWAFERAMKSSVNVNTGGASVKMPVTGKVGSDFGRFAARAAFRHPLLMASAYAAPYLYDWAKSKDYVWDDDGKYWYKPGKTFTNMCPVLNSVDSAAYISWVAQPNKSDFPSVVCNAVYDRLDGVCKWGRGCTYQQWDASYRTDPAIYFISKPEVEFPLITKVPVLPKEFEDDLAPVPVPWEVPNEIPFPVPVETPVLNPGPAPDFAPTPMRVPVGQPIPIPLSNPPAFKEPVIDIVPSPTPLEPFRVDVQPKDIVKTSPTGMTGPTSVPSGTDSAVSEPKESDLCEKYPDILACAKPELGDLKAEDIGSDVKTLSISRDSGWGSSNANCPPARNLNIRAGNISYSYDPFCQFASGIRPVVLAVAWLAAALCFVGVGRKS